ncbi:hypothetical protein L208DRAFT_1519981 [Tricholoma matsutake]|nr:hypothetical protein L208DRAFT_1382486 [Tricholoma matsutake 945]KAF8223093.1 hypothetical protein L208DRAFT_1519981 [Tricholoma matsutake 945]
MVLTYELDSPDQPFNATEWIMCERKYKDVPLAVVDERFCLLRVPTEVQAMLPDSNLPIVEFVKVKLVGQSSSLNTFQMKMWFSQDDPSKNTHETYVQICQWHIPSTGLLNQLDNSFGQAWFNGAHSLVDP